MKKIKYIIITILLTTLSTSCADMFNAADKAISRDKIFTVKGKILTKEKPTANVNLTLKSGSKEIAATTDSNGDFTFTNVVNGSYQIIASKKGYIFAPETAEVEVKNLDLEDIAFTGIDTNNLDFEILSGSAWNDSINSIITSADNMFVTAGEISSLEKKKNVYLAKVLIDGSILWERSFGGNKDDGAHSVVQTTDGGFILTGYTVSKSDEGSDVWVIKTDQNGSLEWDKNFSAGGSEQGLSIIETSEGGFLIAAQINDNNSTNRDIWIIKLDKQGFKVWEKRFGEQFIEESVQIIESSNGDYLFAGSTEIFGVGTSDVWIIKLDKAGNLDWKKTYGNNQDEYAGGIVETGTGSYLFAAYAAASANFDSHVKVYEIDNSGEVLKSESYADPNDQTITALKKDNQGNYILCGTIKYASGKSDMLFLQLDEDLNKNYARTYSNSNHDQANDFCFSNWGGYVIAGSTQVNLDSDFWLFYIDEN